MQEFVLFVWGDLRVAYTYCSPNVVCLNQLGGAKLGGRQEQVYTSREGGCGVEGQQDLRMEKNGGDVKI